MPDKVLEKLRNDYRETQQRIENTHSFRLALLHHFENGTNMPREVHGRTIVIPHETFHLYIHDHAKRMQELTDLARFLE